MTDLVSEFSQRVQAAAKQGSALRPRGGGSKDFHACKLGGEPLDVSGYQGIVNYDPTELIITAKAGTPICDIEATLAEGGQMLACEPPRLSAGSTLGGCVAAGWSGPRRAYAGSVRDFVLGTRILNGRGEDLRFGGEVMKNVAGFDLSRLMTGSFGTLGLILEVSLKVLPRPLQELTLRFDLDEAHAIAAMNAWAAQPLPLSGTAWFDNKLYVRLSGPEPAVRAAKEKMGGEPQSDAQALWTSVRDQTLPHFSGTLWRLSIKSTTPALNLPGKSLLEWNGALRWLNSAADATAVHAAARKAGGHALRYRGGDLSQGLFQPDPAMLKLQQRIMAALDPDNVFSPARLHPSL